MSLPEINISNSLFANFIEDLSYLSDKFIILFSSFLKAMYFFLFIGSNKINFTIFLKVKLTGFFKGSSVFIQSKCL